METQITTMIVYLLNIIWLYLKEVFRNQPRHYYVEEEGYIQLLTDLLEQPIKTNRNGDTHSMFGNTYRFDISDNKLPLLTTKYVSFRNVLHELLWFLRGDTDANILKNNNVKIWNGNSTREFLDNNGFKDYKEGECGPIYGWQWRNFNGDYPNDENKNGKNQILYAINEIKKGSRRAVISGWNPCQLNQMVLPPCHILYIFYVNNQELSCHMTMRSNDTFLGLPYNIASTALLTHIISVITKKIPKEIVISVADAHLYVEHVESAKLQIKNNITSPPLLYINKEFNKNHDILEWIDTLKEDDFTIIDYHSRGRISAPMIA
jgi:thymidylate synthase